MRAPGCCHAFPSRSPTNVLALCSKRMEEEAQRRAEKEREVARLRAMQEREADRQAEDDEKRAQAWQEANERKERERDRERAEFKQVRAQLAAVRAPPAAPPHSARSACWRRRWQCVRSRCDTRTACGSGSARRRSGKWRVSRKTKRAPYGRRRCDASSRALSRTLSACHLHWLTRLLLLLRAGGV